LGWHFVHMASNNALERTEMRASRFALAPSSAQLGR
jgi:hypothetical protein